MINVITPHYRHEAYLPESVLGLIEQSEPNWQLQIMEDSEVCNYHYRSVDKRIFLFGDGTHLGQSIWFNRGIKVAQGDFVALHGADDISLPWRLEESLKAIRGYDVVYSDVIHLLPNGEKKLIRSRPFNLEQLKKANYIPAGTVMVRTEFAKKILFDEDLRYGEDWVWLVKLALAGAKFNYLPMPTYYYRTYSTTIPKLRLPFYRKWRRYELRKRIRKMDLESGRT